MNSTTEKSQKYLMLDLDETLICSSPTFTTLPKINVYIREGLKVIRSFPNVVMRPGLIEFLNTLEPYYNLNIFTASEEEYAEAILNRLGIRHYFRKVYSRDSCILMNGHNYKDLSTLPHPAKDTILIDDMVHHLTNQSDQVLIVAPFTGNSWDKELLKLAPFLVELSKVSDIRPISW
eukprot:CAMPEP_0176409566 /NCGR_PEP_ID=MMETSP0127-20121128/2570_1 /TAXON_ID=938130 /ORGANISM="Platyophrya macrostoma, Strain WH" /LENGTH=176 /DNA_ID=CAMNT_0017788961 /DNA_START=35 /DNA_END=562 /DNA_ORIENTATION=+